MINTANENGIAVYPNPARRFINADICGNVSAGTELQLINSLGMLVKRFTISTSGTHVLAVQDLPAGIYRLLMKAPGQVTKALVVSIVH